MGSSKHSFPSLPFTSSLTAGKQANALKGANLMFNPTCSRAIEQAAEGTGGICFTDGVSRGRPNEQANGGGPGPPQADIENLEDGIFVPEPACEIEVIAEERRLDEAFLMTPESLLTSTPEGSICFSREQRPDEAEEFRRQLGIESSESLSSGGTTCNFITARTSSSKIEKQNKHIQSCFYPVVKGLTLHQDPRSQREGVENMIQEAL
ncbi:hypothetical protein Y1Q_0019050 [Alligator mississippiensis]|uniref:Uncharacterized protein n=1 Tax=Alligator mississippiensis TaxID=8496 RepID=A0A151PJA9_ALLMI|nr:hypothetical protein Y1Q_0019050 [Alligator mississippiensis]